MSTLNEIKEYLRKHADRAHAEGMQVIAPGAKKIYGVRGSDMHTLLKAIKPGSFALIDELWDSGIYEARMLAVKLLEWQSKTNPERGIATVMRFAPEINNWAICDTIGMKSLKKLNKKYPERILSLAEQFAMSPNMWERRLSMVILWDLCKDKKWHPRIRKIADMHRGDKEKYLKKAVVWLDKTLRAHAVLRRNADPDG